MMNEKKRYAGQLNKYKEIFSSIEEGREIKCALYFPEFGRLELCFRVWYNNDK